MKIWLSSVPVHRLEHGGDREESECDDCSSDYDDCTIVNPYPSSVFSSSLTQSESQLYTQCLQQASSLYLYRCDDEHWLVCDPIGSGKIVVVDTDALDLLQQFRTLKATSEVVAAYGNEAATSLMNLVMLFYRLGLLKSMQEPLHVQTQGALSTLTAWLHVTNACNLRCQYCYLSKSSEYMNDDIARQAVDAIFRSAKKQHFQKVKLKYAGGEASLSLRQLIEIHDYAMSQAQENDLAFGAHILSNGVVLSQRTIDQLKARQIGVTISLDGVGAYHDSQRPFANGLGSFKYVDRTIARLLASDLVPHITVTVSQRNLDGLPALMTYILERGMTFTLSYYRDNECSSSIDDLQFSEQQMITSMMGVFALIEQKLPQRSLLGSLIDKANLAHAHSHTCGVGKNYLVIDQNGGVAKCQMDIKRNVTTIQADDILQHVNNDQEGLQGLAVDDKEGCRTCEWRYWCAGGCPLLTYRMTGRYDIRSPNCGIYKALFPQALRLEALRLLKYVSPVVF